MQWKERANDQRPGYGRYVNFVSFFGGSSFIFILYFFLLTTENGDFVCTKLRGFTLLFPNCVCAIFLKLDIQDTRYILFDYIYIFYFIIVVFSCSYFAECPEATVDGHSQSDKKHPGR